MRRGTTPTHIITYSGYRGRKEVDGVVIDEGTEIDMAEADELYITYQQNGVNLLEKTKEDCSFADHVVYVRLTQAETLAFSPTGVVKVQIRPRFGEDALASDIMKISVEEILKDGEI